VTACAAQGRGRCAVRPEMYTHEEHMHFFFCAGNNHWQCGPKGVGVAERSGPPQNEPSLLEGRRDSITSAARNKEAIAPRQLALPHFRAQEMGNCHVQLTPPFTARHHHCDYEVKRTRQLQSKLRRKTSSRESDIATI
jgi:hypothetical protein